MNWRDTERFPQVERDGWQARRNGREILGQAAVERAMSTWHPLDSLLVALPGADQLLPALVVPQIKQKLHESFLRRIRISIEFVLLCAAISLFLSLDKPALSSTALMLLGLALFLIADYLTVGVHSEALAERNLYSSWVRGQSRRDLMLWGGLMICTGAIQLLLVETLGFDKMLLEYGTLFSALQAGEIWRAFVGPFFHADLLHWGMNSLMLVFVGQISGTISRPHSIGVFFIGSVLGVISTWIASTASNVEAYVGVSAGVIGLFGLCAGFAWLHPSRFPKKFSFTLLAFSAMQIVLGWTGTSSAANEAHIVGLVAGVCWGVMLGFRTKVGQR